MKKLSLVFVLSLLVLSNPVLAQLGITIDAERDAYWNTLTGPENGHILIPHNALIIGTDATCASNEDLSALVWLGWDVDYFYAYFEIQDDILLVNNASGKYNNDAMELKFDPDPTQQSAAGVVGFRLTAWGADMADDPAGVDNLESGESAVPWTAVEGEDYARKEVAPDNSEYYGYNLEFRIPWASIATASPAKTVTVDVGAYFGLAVNILDNDATARDNAIQWSAGLNDIAWSDAQQHGTAEFLADGKINLLLENSAGGTAVNADAAWYIPPAPSGVHADGQMAADFELAQNYPNPFNPSTTIDFSVKTSGQVKLAIYDVLGREIRTLVHESLSRGRYSTRWDGLDNEGMVVPSGIYIYQVEAGVYKASKKLSFIR